MKFRHVGPVVALSLLWGCGSSQNGGAATDAGSDLGADLPPADTGQDAGPGDVGVDAGPGDVGVADAGPGDVGVADAGSGDVGVADAGSGDVGVDVVVADAGVCAANTGNCDNNASNGCETDLNTSNMHCGFCGAACPAGQTCFEGACGTATALSAGTVHTCAIRGGRVFCWGENGSWQLGRATPAASPTALRVDEVRDAVEVAVDGNFTCARLSSGRVRCWGENNAGQLGAGLAVGSGMRFAPSDVEGITDALSVRAGSGFACAVRAGGRVSCWGSNGARQLADGAAETVMHSAVPRELPSLQNVTSLALAGHGCAVTSVNTVFCWGRNVAGEAGVSQSPLSAAVQVPGVSGVVKAAAGVGYTLAVLSDGTVWCWGENGAGQCGNRMRGASRIPPGAVPGLSDIVDVTAGVQSACAVNRTGQVYCWGSGSRGELGTGVMTFSNADPTVVPMLTDVEALVGFPNFASVQANHRCALRRLASNRVFCWGYNEYGQVGDGTTETRAAPVLALQLP
ncbi:MAG: hypothetical protein JNK72_24310 [Myxococcales bacterium]|nr:hypothetical protein [Myxococcales bacterium]